MAMVAAADNKSSHWVFGYGSLIWNPGFVYRQARQALLQGAHRSLCIYSHHHRGTPDRPGLVFGLVRGGSCRGMAFEVDPEHWHDVREYLRQREQVTDVYREANRPIRFAGGESATALAFVVDERHVQYAGRLEIEQQLRMVRAGVGQSGANIDYVLNTARHLRELGIRDRHLQELAALLEEARDDMIARSA